MVQIITSTIIGSDDRPMLVDLRIDNQIPNQPVIIFVHGFKGFKDWGHFPKVGEELAKAGFAFVSFNFTHDGTTVDRPAEFSDLEGFGHNNYHKELYDTEQVINAISDGLLFPEFEFDRNKIFLLGHSRGGGISIIKTSENDRVKGLVTWASMGNMRRSEIDFKNWMRDGVVHIPNARTDQQMPMYYQFVEDYFAQEERYDLEKSCGRINVSALFIHGTSDVAVPVGQAKQLHHWATGSELILIEDGDHTFGGKHPFEETELPTDTQTALAATIMHFRMCSPQ